MIAALRVSALVYDNEVHLFFVMIFQTVGFFSPNKTSPIRRGIPRDCGSSQVQSPPRPVRSWIRENNRILPCRSDAVRSASTAVALYDRSTHLRGHTRPTRPPPPPGCVRSSLTASGSTTTVSICTALTDQHHQQRSAPTHPLPRDDQQDVSTTHHWRTTM